MAKDAKTKAKAKALYEAGQSFREVAQAVGTSFTSVKLWAKKEAWTKGKAAPKIAQREEMALEREAERLGLTKARVAAKIVSLMEARKTVFHQGIPMAETEDNGTQLGATGLAADILGMKKAEVDAGEGFRAFFQALKGAA